MIKELGIARGAIGFNEVANLLIADPSCIAIVVDILMSDDANLAARAAWALRLVGERNATLLQPHLPKFAERLAMPGTPDGVKRNLLGHLERISIPEELHGPLMNLCFEWLASPAEAIAVRVFSMGVLSQLSLHYPELRYELAAIIRYELDQGEPSAGFRSRARKVLAKMER